MSSGLNEKGPGGGNSEDLRITQGDAVQNTPNAGQRPSPPAFEIALEYIRRGWNPVPIAFKEKKPIGKDWQNRTVTEETVRAVFDRLEMNIGVQLGPKSGGLVDVDLDCPEAIKLAAYFLPATGSKFGRPSSLNSHWLFTSDPAEIPEKAHIPFKDPVAKKVEGKDKPEHSMLLEIRCGGGSLGAQSVFPGSIHRETGEPIKWETDVEPARVAFADLQQNASELAAAVAFVQAWPGGSGHDAQLTLGGFLARLDWDAGRIENFAAAVACGVGADEREFLRCVGDSVANHAEGGKVYGFTHLKETFGEPHAKAIAKWLGEAESVTLSPDESGKPVIQIKVDEVHVAATLGEKALVESSIQIFQRGGTLVQPVVREVVAAEGRRTETAQLLKVEAPNMRDLLREAAAWRKYDGRSKGLVPADVPPEVALSILTRQRRWTFPTITGVTNCPTMRPDGSIFSRPGYDPATGLLLVGLPPMPPIPDEPTLDDARGALTLLKELLVDFPFVDVDLVDMAVALSALITPVVRGAFKVTPMHCASAPAAGSGKSFLFDLAAAIATGQRMPVMSAGASEEELEKRLGAVLMTGQPLISIDNVNGMLRGDALGQAIERHLLEIRILGRSEHVQIEAGGTSIFCTGNNIAIAGDLCRRTITTTMDPKEDRPELRKFKGDPFERILANRGVYIASALTICRAYFVAGRPGKADPLASFGG
jgi:hypothetical protein